MPRLRNLNCSVRWTKTDVALDEYQTAYADSRVETWLAIPEKGKTGEFFIRLTSDSYVAPGVAMFVYIDGVYQCNRNQRRLVLPSASGSGTKSRVNIKARQREEFNSDGSISGRPWLFSPVSTGNDANIDCGKMIKPIHKPHFDGKYVGVIEIVVLRCGPADRTPSLASLYRIPSATEHMCRLQLGKDFGHVADEGLSFFKPAPKNRQIHSQSAVSGSLSYKQDGVDTSLPAKNEKWKMQSDHCDKKSEYDWKESVRAARDERADLSIAAQGANDEAKLFASEQLDSPAEIRDNVLAAMCTAKKDYHGRWNLDPPDLGSKAAMKKFGATHFTHLGERMPYMHKLAKPTYIDSHRRPYAVFRFYYRHTAMVQHILEIPTTETDEAKALRALSKEELVTKLMKLKTTASEESDTASGKSSGNNDQTDAWGDVSRSNVQSDDWGKSSIISNPVSQPKDHGWGTGTENHEWGKGATNETWNDAQGLDGATDHVTKQNSSAEDFRAGEKAPRSGRSESGLAQHAPQWDDAQDCSNQRGSDTFFGKATATDRDDKLLEHETLREYYERTWDSALRGAKPSVNLETEAAIKAMQEEWRNGRSDVLDGVETDPTGIVPQEDLAARAKASHSEFDVVGLGPKECWPSLDGDKHRRREELEKDFREGKSRRPRPSGALPTPCSLRDEVLEQEYRRRFQSEHELGAGRHEISERERGMNRKAASLPDHQGNGGRAEIEW